MKEDLRVVKTKKNIKTEMMELLQKKPVEKITVTELASNAFINKGTFYHHYSDIYDLYHELVYDFIENSIMHYVKQVIPSTTILKYYVPMRDLDMNCFHRTYIQSAIINK